MGRRLEELLIQLDKHNDRHSERFARWHRAFAFFDRHGRSATEGRTTSA